jgi:hypothetical protein
LKTSVHAVRLQHGFDSVIIVAKNNRAAKLVGGVTLASLFPMDRLNSKNESIKIAALASLKKRFTGVKLMMFDEKSLASLEDAFDIKTNLELAFPERNLPAGGISIIFIGDYFQLPPVGQVRWRWIIFFELYNFASAPPSELL